MPCSVFGVTQNAKPYFAQALRKNAHTQVLCITATEQGARDMAAAQGGVLFPDNDFSLRSVEAKGREEELRRVGILKNTAQAKGVVYLSVRTFLSRMLPPDRFRESCLLLQTGREYDPEELLHALARSCLLYTSRCV